MTNQELGVITADKADLIIRAANEVIEGKLDSHFPLGYLANRFRHADKHERQ